jgi:hypothetical protein
LREVGDQITHANDYAVTSEDGERLYWTGTATCKIDAIARCKDGLINPIMAGVLVAVDMAQDSPEAQAVSMMMAD